MKHMILLLMVFGVTVMLNNGEHLKFKDGCYPILHDNVGSSKVLEIRCKSLDGGGIAYATPFSRIKWVSCDSVSKNKKEAKP